MINRNRKLEAKLLVANADGNISDIIMCTEDGDIINDELSRICYFCNPPDCNRKAVTTSQLKTLLDRLQKLKDEIKLDGSFSLPYICKVIASYENVYFAVHRKLPSLGQNETVVYQSCYVDLY